MYLFLLSVLQTSMARKKQSVSVEEQRKRNRKYQREERNQTMIQTAEGKPLRRKDKNGRRGFKR